VNDDLAAFESNRPVLRALAYRMLGDLSRAEDLVQEAWVRWQGRTAEVDDARAFLVRTVTRLCLNELDSARVRHEESRGDRLPEPVDLAQAGIPEVETLDQVSMAFLVLLQRLGPSERAVLLLHEVFDMSHAEIATMLGKSEAACRQLLSRARSHVASERRVFRASREEHRRLLLAFVKAAREGSAAEMLALLAEDATLIIDPGPEGARVGRIRAVGRPVEGAKRIAAFLAAVAGQLPSGGTFRECVLNGAPAVVRVRDGRPVAAILVSVADGRIRHVFMQVDARRLSHLGPVH
jgi:RNA polymerase sigma-70 factor (ECF subfamily)